MRIAYIVADSGIPVCGYKGASVHVRELVRALAAQHSVSLFCAALGPAECSLPVESIDVVPPPEVPDHPDESSKRDRRRLAGVASMRDVVHEAHRARPFDAVYERYSLFSDVGAGLASIAGLPFALEVNAPLLIERRRVEPLPLWPVAKEIEQAVFGQADAVLAVSEGVATYVAKAGADERRVHVVPNGVDTSRFHPNLDTRKVRTKLGMGDSVVIGFVGSLKPWHGVDLLIDAFTSCARPDWRLLIVGDGPERQTLESQAVQSGLGQQIAFTGPISHADIPLYVSAMDIPVAPYRWTPDFYFSPLKLYEYLAAGKAVIASDVGQIARAIRHEENGYLVLPDNVASLSDALTRLAGDARLRERLEREAPRGLVTWEKVAHQVTTILDSVKSEQLIVQS